MSTSTRSATLHVELWSQSGWLFHHRTQTSELKSSTYLDVEIINGKRRETENSKKDIHRDYNSYTHMTFEFGISRKIGIVKVT